MQRGPQPSKLKIPRPVKRELKRLVRRLRAPHCLVVRARIVLMAGKGLGTREISSALSIGERTVRKWKARFAETPIMATLNDSPRAGRPAIIPLEVRCRLVQLACERPDKREKPAPFRDIWTYQSLADSLEECSGQRISVSEVGRILRFENLRPHRVKQWLKSRDPDFVKKAKRVCRMYLNPPKDTVVICVDEKPMQVLERKYPSRVNKKDGSVRHEYEYKRHGTQTLLAAFEVKTGKTFGRVVPHRDAKTLVSFMKALARRYAGKKICIVWDNLNTHHEGPNARWTKFNQEQGGRFRFVHTPIHASWMNQVEVWFSILQRRVIKYGNFSSAAEQAERVLGFMKHWNAVERHPFRWTWRTDKLQNEERLAA